MSQIQDATKRGELRHIFELSHGHAHWKCPNVLATDLHTGSEKFRPTLLTFPSLEAPSC